MASIRERPRAGGRTVWAVLYRHGTKQSSLSLDTLAEAEKFKVLVDTFGADKALKMIAEEEVSGLTVDELATQFLEYKAQDVTARTLTDYRRDYENWIKPWFGHRVAATVDEGDVQR